MTSRFKGIVTKLHHNVGDMAKVGKPLIDIDTGSEATAPTKTPDQKPASQQKDSAPAPAPTNYKDIESQSEHVLATPAVRRVAREQHIDLRTVPGRDRKSTRLNSSHT